MSRRRAAPFPLDRERRRTDERSLLGGPIDGRMQPAQVARYLDAVQRMVDRKGGMEPDGAHLIGQLLRMRRAALHVGMWRVALGYVHPKASPALAGQLARAVLHSARAHEALEKAIEIATRESDGSRDER